MNDVDLTILICSDNCALFVIPLSTFNEKSWGSSKTSFFPFSSQSLWKGSSTVNFNFFQIIMVSLFLAHHDQHFIMFKDSSFFEFINFPFKTNYNNTVVYSANSNHLFSKGKKRTLRLTQLFC